MIKILPIFSEKPQGSILKADIKGLPNDRMWDIINQIRPDVEKAARRNNINEVLYTQKKTKEGDVFLLINAGPLTSSHKITPKTRNEDILNAFLNNISTNKLIKDVKSSLSSVFEMMK